jgi:hypothetical protein
MTYAGKISNVTATLTPVGMAIEGTLLENGAAVTLNYSFQDVADDINSYLSSLDGLNVTGGGQGEGLDLAENTLGAFSLSYDLTIKGITGAQRLSNYATGANYAIQDISKMKLANVGNLGKLTFEGTGTTLGLVGLGLTGADIIQNGLNWSNGTDAVMGLVAFIPVVGWAISGAYFLTNMIVQYETGESIGQHIGDAIGHP